MGRMLFWGQQGVAPDIQTAVKHYERGATKLHDPVSMYDYAIVLLTVRILSLLLYAILDHWFLCFIVMFIKNIWFGQQRAVLQSV